MYSRNARPISDKTVRIPENYGGSFLRPNLKEEYEKCPPSTPEADNGQAGRAECEAPPPHAAAPRSIFPINFASHFPFGHGLGFEELFLLGLILVLAKEEADEQMILFLIILLFCG